MQIWNKLFPQHLNRLRHVATFMLFVSLIGFADASFLTVEHFRGEIPNCSVVHGCGNVLTSDFATFFGIPVALFGALYYLGIFFGCFLFLDTRKDKVIVYTARATVLGILASAYFFFIQAFILHSWCQYCIGSIITSTLLFISGLVIEKLK